MDFDQNRAGPRKGSVALEKIGGAPALRIPLLTHRTIAAIFDILLASCGRSRRSLAGSRHPNVG